LANEFTKVFRILLHSQYKFFYPTIYYSTFSGSFQEQFGPGCFIYSGQGIEEACRVQRHFQLGLPAYSENILHLAFHQESKQIL